MTRNSYVFAMCCLAFIAGSFVLTQELKNEYPFYAGYAVLQFVVLATAWNITGGYAGYVNFGAAGFFGAGAYTAVALYKAFEAPLVVQLLGGLVVGGLLGLFVGYLSARMRGMYFSLVTLALAVLIDTVVVNLPFLGGARGSPILPPPPIAPFATNTRFLFFVMALLAVGTVACARAFERSRFGRGLAAIRDDETAAESCGIPTFRIKCIAMILSGALMALAGAPFAFHSGFVEPATAFNLNLSLSALAMPLLGGTGYWLGPVLGATILASAQQLITVTISSEYNLLVLGLILVFSVVLMPNGVLGLVAQIRRNWRGRKAAHP